MGSEIFSGPLLGEFPGKRWRTPGSTARNGRQGFDSLISPSAHRCRCSGSSCSCNPCRVAMATDCWIRCSTWMIFTGCLGTAWLQDTCALVEALDSQIFCVSFASLRVGWRRRRRAGGSCGRWRRSSPARASMAARAGQLTVSCIQCQSECSLRVAVTDRRLFSRSLQKLKGTHVLWTWQWS